MAQRLSLIYVPYDSGIHGMRMGAGPSHVRASGLASTLAAGGVEVEETTIDLGHVWPAEIAAAFALHAAVATAVRGALSRNAFPVVFSGNCNTGAVGLASGVETDRLGVLWFDAHDDFETPETTTTGFLDGMGLALLTGKCWRSMSRLRPETACVAGRRVALVGVRDTSREALQRLDDAEVATVDATTVRSLSPAAVFAPFLDRVTREGVSRAIVHADMDVLDPIAVAPANGFAAPGGLSVEELFGCVTTVAGRLPLVGASIASFDPACDRNGRMAGAIHRLVEHLGRSAA